jgi:hypothetical protein
MVNGQHTSESSERSGLLKYVETQIRKLLGKKPMTYKLFLDDVRRPKTTFQYMGLPIYNEPNWIIVRNYYAFISLIETKGLPDVISFDHDLSFEHYKQQNFDYTDETYEKTGYHCAKWLIDYCIDNELKVPTRIIVHSMNSYGSLNIKSLFETYFRVYDINEYYLQTCVVKV